MLILPRVPGSALTARLARALLSAMATTWNREALLQLSLLVTFGWMNVGPVLPALGLSFGALLVALGFQLPGSIRYVRTGMDLRNSPNDTKIRLYLLVDT